MLNFKKYHGAGNDFIMLSDESQDLQDQHEYLNHLCRRHLGVGADGVIWVSPIDRHTLQMTYHNADGKPGSFCGNGARCAIKYAFDHNWCDKKGELIFDSARRHFEVLDINTISVEFPIEISIQSWQDGFFIDTGSPHLVFNVEADFLKTMDIAQLAKPHRYHEDFADIGGTNVNYFAFVDNKVHIRTFERGVEAETLACGTGAMAVGSVVLEKFDTGFKDHVVLEALGGRLELTKRENYWLSGPAVGLFSGTLAS